MAQQKPNVSAMTFKDAQNLRQEFIPTAVTLFYGQKPLKITRAQKQYMYGEHDTKYLDCINNVAHVGHCHQKVYEAESTQAAILSTNSRFLYGHNGVCAQKLVAKMPGALKMCFFVNSGSEANDLALQLAHFHTRAKDVITLEHAYHGHLASLIPISTYKSRRMQIYEQPDWAHVAPTPDVYRGLHRKTDDNDTRDFALKYAQEVKAIIEKIQNQGKKVSAFIAESGMSCAGQILLPSGYLKYVYKYVRAAGGVCIADEVQVGFGRFGKHYWAFQSQEVVPDIVTVGKPMGNGYPVAAVITTKEIADSFRAGFGTYFNTYGGNPVACAVATAVMDTIDEEQLMQHAERVGEYMLELLAALKKKYPAIIGDVRGTGLFWGVDLVMDPKTRTPAMELAEEILNRFKEDKIIVSRDGPYDNILKLKPPMTFSKEDAETFANHLDIYLADYSRSSK